MNKKSYFEYNDGKEITKGAFRIGASQVSKFFDSTSVWYRENLLGESEFTGNTATHLGTVVHAAIEMYVLEGSVDWEALQNHIDSIDHPEVDNDHITKHYQTMVDTAIGYVQNNIPDKVEEFIFHEILPGIGAGGSIDAIYGDPVYYVEE